MKPLLSIKRLLGLLVIPVMLFIHGCGTPLQFAQSDVDAVKGIYAQSDWTFRESEITLDVRESETIFLSIKGSVEGLTNEGRKNQGPILIPTVFMKSLPTYFEAYNSSHQNIELITYQAQDGYWGIVALLPADFPSGDQLGTEYPVEISLLMISSEFTSRLPDLVSSGQGKTAVKLNVLLPKSGDFLSDVVNTVTRSGTTKTSLAILPGNLSGDNVHAIANLIPGSQKAWDLSKVKFRFPTSSSGVSSRLFLSCVIILFALSSVLLSCFILLFEGRRRREIEYEERRRRREIEYEEGRRRREIESEIEYEERKRPRKVGYYDQDMFYLTGREFMGFLDRKDSLSRFLMNLDYLFLLFAFVLFCLFLFLYQEPAMAAAVTGGRQIVDYQLILGDFRLGIEDIDIDSNKLQADVEFFPLSLDSESSSNSTAKATLELGSPESKIIDIEIKSDSKVLIDRRTRSVSDIKLSAIYNEDAVPLLPFFNLGVRSIERRPVYLRAIQKSEFIEFTYVIDEILSVNDSNAGGWFYFFPFDNITFDFALSSSQPAIVSQIEIAKPQDFTGEIMLDGVGAKVKRTGDKFKLDLDPDIRVLMQANTPLKITGKLHRNRFQQVLLTLGMIVAAIICGVVLGVIACLPNNDAAAIVVNGLGFVSLPFVARSTVFSTYSELPTLLSGRGTSIFEISFIASWLLFGLVAILICFNARSKKA